MLDLKTEAVGLAGGCSKDHVPPFCTASPDHCQLMYPRGTGITAVEGMLGCHIKYIVALKEETAAAVAFEYRGIAGLSFADEVVAPTELSS